MCDIYAEVCIYVEGCAIVPCSTVALIIIFQHEIDSVLSSYLYEENIDQTELLEAIHKYGTHK